MNDEKIVPKEFFDYMVVKSPIQWVRDLYNENFDIRQVYQKEFREELQAKLEGELETIQNFFVNDGNPITKFKHDIPAQEFPNQHLSKVISKLKDFQATVYRLYEEKHEIYNQNIEDLCEELKEFQKEYEENVVARGLDKQEFPMDFKCEDDEAFYVYHYPLTKSSEELSQFRQSFIKGRMIEFFSVALAPKSFVFEKDQFYNYRTVNCKLLEGVFSGRIDYDLAQELTHGTCEV